MTWRHRVAAAPIGLMCLSLGWCVGMPHRETWVDWAGLLLVAYVIGSVLQGVYLLGVERGRDRRDGDA